MLCLNCYFIGTIKAVAIITTKAPTIIGTIVRFTITSGEIFATPEVATTTPETGLTVRAKFEACSIGITKNAGAMPRFAASEGMSSTKA